MASKPFFVRFSSIVLHVAENMRVRVRSIVMLAYLGSRVMPYVSHFQLLHPCYPLLLRQNNNIEVRKMKFRLLILASIAAFIAVANPESVQEVFDPHSGEESYQRRYVISVLNKAEDCYYIPEVRTNQIINFHFVVSLLFF